MTVRSMYFAKAPLVGPGKLHFLVTPQEAPPGSASRQLLGSLVEEMDIGMFGLKQVPGFDHVWKREYLLQVMAMLPGIAGQQLVNEAGLASVSQSLKIDRKFKLGANAPIPGVPASASIGADYTKLKSVTMELGAGCTKYYIPKGFLSAAYDHAQKHSNQVDKEIFDDDYMAVNQVLIVRQMKLVVESNAVFSASFDAKADQITDLKVGVSYSRKSDRTYEIELDDGKDYLFAIGAVQLDAL